MIRLPFPVGQAAISFRNSIQMPILALKSHDPAAAKNPMNRCAMTSHDPISQSSLLQQPQDGTRHRDARLVTEHTAWRAAAHRLITSQDSMPRTMNHKAILKTTLKTTLAAALATAGAAALAETDGERALRLENERQINELNTRIMIENRNADDAVRAQMEAQRNGTAPSPAPATVSPQAATMARYASQKQAAEQLLGLPVMSYVGFLALQSGVPAAARKEIDATPVRLVQSTGLLNGDAELDANGVYRQGNVMQIAYAAKLVNGRGYVGRRIHVTCGASTPVLVLSSMHFARTKAEAARLARNPAFYGFSGAVQATRLSPEASRRVQELCAQAKPAKFEMAVPVQESGSSWSTVPVSSIQRSVTSGRVGWVVLNNSPSLPGQLESGPAWNEAGVPIQRKAAVAGSFGGGLQWSASCATGEIANASLFVDQSNKVIAASPVESDGRLMQSMPAHTRLAFEFACAAAGAT